MHGRPRKSSKPEDEQASFIKAQKLRALQSTFLSNHHNCNYTKEALDVSAKLLEINPESYTAWNYRKLAVQHYIAESNSDPESLKSILDVELRVVESALRQNFKSYGAWHHRKWVLSKGHSSIDHELRLLDRLQKADSRNFHAWNYRRFVAAMMKRSEVDELNYTTEMIDSNFSNYSAWHNRSILLSSLLEKKAEGFFPKEKTLNEEYELVHQAIFTDPDDQSGWFYYLWLLDQTVKTEAPLLVSSWPAHGSNIILTRDGTLDAAALSIFRSFHLESGIFPLVLCFSQEVGGVSSATISVESPLCTSNDDLIWEPISTNNSNSAKVWVARMKTPDKELQLCEAYPVEVILGHSQGIISLSGFHYRHCTRITFEVCVQSSATESTAEQNYKRVLWKDENFHICTTPLDKLNRGVSLGHVTVDEVDETTSEWRAETITNEISLFRELLSEIDCKIGKLTLARLLSAHDAIVPQSPEEMAHSKVLKMYIDLENSDPHHSCYYKDEYSLVLLRQITSNLESLSKRCYVYTNSKSSTLDNFFCLRLNNLSLTRVGSTEKLLWVQMLDLNHNELQSIEGLEALQLLSCLNLSHNKLGSITALRPLRPLKYLKVLDVSFNNIGLHSTDTTRYLCPSPLSHREEIEWKCDELVTCNADVEKYWEAFLVFKGMKLEQLDISENAIANEQFKSFLVSYLPTLKCLDGGVLHR